jgi:hypothetical protein
MSIPSLLEVFESGLDGPPKSSPNSTSLESIIRHKLENAVRETYSGSTNSPESPQSCSEPGSVLNEMGDYLTRTASIWARLTQDLMMGSHIDDLAMDAHEQANRETRLSDLSAVVAIDTELGKLRYVLMTSGQTPPKHAISSHLYIITYLSTCLKLLYTLTLCHCAFLERSET